MGFVHVRCRRGGGSSLSNGRAGDHQARIRTGDFLNLLPSSALSCISFLARSDYCATGGSISEGPSK